MGKAISDRKHDAANDVAESLEALLARLDEQFPDHTVTPEQAKSAIAGQWLDLPFLDAMKVYVVGNDQFILKKAALRHAPVDADFWELAKKMAKYTLTNEGSNEELPKGGFSGLVETFYQVLIEEIKA